MSQGLPDLFSPSTDRWFCRAVGQPTAVQSEAWPVIASGRHTLVSAPTGTGKTLAAFLVFIDRLRQLARRGELKQALQLIYISPLKSLAGDIRENLDRPLQGIARQEREDAEGIVPQLDVGIRTGDTTQSERRRMLRTPPHILITTPESLYLLLTSGSGAAMLHTARWIIVDELHALIDTKRGAHLMLSLARLDRLCGRPLQRIGLSATIRPLERAAAYLAPEPAAVVAPPMEKAIDLRVISPFSDLRKPGKDTVWQAIAEGVYRHCLEVRSVIAFVEARAYAEKLAYFVNQLGGEAFARTHHGSMSREQRFEVEQALRAGTVRLLCATSSMELGIDVGEIDLVVQVGCPRTVSSALQRLGRAGHNPGRVSVMLMFPRTPAEALASGLTAEVMRAGGVEPCRPPRLCLDVLAQHLVSLAAGGRYDLDDVLVLLARAYPFRDVTRDDVRAVLEMLAGDEEHARDIPVRPRLLYDRLSGQVSGDSYSRLLAVSTGGTIPDRGLYTVRTEQGVILGQLDEEFVFEARLGDKFLLGTFAWKIRKVQKDAVIVAQTSSAGALPPFWKGDIRGRSLQTGQAFGALLRRLGEAHDSSGLIQALQELGLDAENAEAAESMLRRQIAVTGVLPNDRTLLAEHFRDENGTWQLMVHSVFGRQVNEPLAILASEQAKRLTGTVIGYVADDDGFLLFPYGDAQLPDNLLLSLRPETAESVLAAALPLTPLFNIVFRYNAARALMMGLRKAGRQPLWVQRMRAAELLDALAGQESHPLIRETRRECLEDHWNLDGVRSILAGIRSGAIRVRELQAEQPSPLSLPLRQQTEAAMMYDYAPTLPGTRKAAETALAQADLIEPDPEQLARTGMRRKIPQDAEQLHSLLMVEGDLEAGELEVPAAWLDNLHRDGRARYIEPGIWIAAEEHDLYAKALEAQDQEARSRLVRRLLRYRGAQTAEQVDTRYMWPEGTAQAILSDLCVKNSAVCQDLVYYHAQLYERARQETIRSRRQQIRTVPSERYAALLADRLQVTASPQERLGLALDKLSGQAFLPAWWESVLLPARVPGYRPEQLDLLLAGGQFSWRFTPEQAICFQRDADYDWASDPEPPDWPLTAGEQAVCDALRKWGASFMSRLAGALDGASPYEILLGLAEKGLVQADSFIPVRQWLNRERLVQAPVKQRVRARAAALSAGRWSCVRPLKPLSAEQLVERAFDQAVILCRETISGLPWDQALDILSLWEFTGRVRRGYFVAGWSGMQFVRDADFAAVVLALEQPPDPVVWLPAVDPAQPWGKSLTHLPDRSFLNVPGTLVALRAGLPVAVFERQGQLLRCFDPESLPGALKAFARGFSDRRFYPQASRVAVRQYPPDAAKALQAAGFVRDVMDFVLFREAGR